MFNYVNNSYEIFEAFLQVLYQRDRPRINRDAIDHHWYYGSFDQLDSPCIAKKGIFLRDKLDFDSIHNRPKEPNSSFALENGDPEVIKGNGVCFDTKNVLIPIK